MGTQQLLLIVLGVILVGIAIAVGTVPIFERAMMQSNKDAVTQDCLKLAAGAQGYFRRPRLYAGGDNSFTNIGIANAGMADDGNGNGHNANGTYTVDGSNGTTCVIVGASNEDPSSTVTVVVHAGWIENPVFAGTW